MLISEPNSWHPDAHHPLKNDVSARNTFANYYHRTRAAWSYYRDETVLPAALPRGHYCSPLPDPEQGALHSTTSLTRDPRIELPGIDLQIDEQKTLLLRMAELYPEFDWPEQSCPDRRFHFDQGWFKHADSLSLYSMLRLYRPNKVIEVGSGFSSALMLDVNERFLDRSIRFTFIEPSPERLERILRDEDRRSVQLISQPVQAVSVDTFKSLEKDDILFVDSSHVSKVGSDTHYLFFEVMPTLSSGVLVHIHDIFWPFEYPADWIREGRAWNEAYLLRAFLCFNYAFKIIFWSPLMAMLEGDVIRQRMPLYLRNTGASIWLRKTG